VSEVLLGLSKFIVFYLFIHYSLRTYSRLQEIYYDKIKIFKFKGGLEKNNVELDRGIEKNQKEKSRQARARHGCAHL
jgi:hypothetical protein